MLWLGDAINFLVKTKFLLPLLTVVFFTFILLHVLSRIKKKDFTSKINKHLLVLLVMFSIYVYFVLIADVAIKDYFLYPFDYIFFTQLCGAIMLWCLFIFNAILTSSGLITALIGVPIGFFGALAGYLSFNHYPNVIFPKSMFGSGHAPGEFFLIDLFLLTIYSLLIVLRNLVVKIRDTK